MTSAAMPLRSSPGVRKGLSIGIAVGLYGISFGALAVAAGLTVTQVCAFSLLMFTGGSQFAFIGVVAGGGGGPAAVGAASLLGLRNAIYGVQMNAMVRPSRWHRLLAAHLTIDESAATAMSQVDPVEERRGFWSAGLAVFVLWNTFTLLGALAGNALGDPKIRGLDGAAVAAFVGLLWPRLTGREPIAVALVCGLVTASAVPLLPAGVPILVTAGVAAALGLAQKRSRGNPADAAAEEQR